MHTLGATTLNRIIYISVILGSVLLALFSGLRFAQELIWVPGNYIYGQVSENASLRDEDLKNAERSFLQGAQLRDSAEINVKLGFLYQIWALRSKNEARRLHLLLKASGHLRRGIQAAPLNAYALAQLASIYIQIGPLYYDEAANFWRASIATARFEPMLMTKRIHIGVLLFDELSALDKGALRLQIELAYNWNAHELRVYSKQHGLVEWMRFLSPEGSEQADYLGAPV